MTMPVVATSDLTGTVLEAVTPAGNLTDSGTIAFTDVDLTDAHASHDHRPLVRGAGHADRERHHGHHRLRPRRRRDLELQRGGLGGGVPRPRTRPRSSSFTITLDDGNGGTVDRTIEVTITGTNDAPVIAAQDLTGAVTEQVTPAGNLTDSGTIAFTDVDLTDVHSIGAGDRARRPDGAGRADGERDHRHHRHRHRRRRDLELQRSPASAVEYLGQARPRSRPSPSRSTTATAARSPSTIEVTITGTNDAPVITARGPDRRGDRAGHPGRQPDRQRHHRLHRRRPDRRARRVGDRQLRRVRHGARRADGERHAPTPPAPALGGVVTWTYTVAGLGGRVPGRRPDQGRELHRRRWTTATAARSPSTIDGHHHRHQRRAGDHGAGPRRRGDRAGHPGRQPDRQRHHRLHRRRPDRRARRSATGSSGSGTARSAR